MKFNTRTRAFMFDSVSASSFNVKLMIEVIWKLDESANATKETSFINSNYLLKIPKNAQKVTTLSPSRSVITETHLLQEF